MTNELPRAPSRRWQPLRSGLMNIFRYDYDEFHFERGHLLLRGNNGTGKSRVLALQLPFLLDGEVSPARLEPDGDPAKRIEWNLLVDRHESRTGYTWIEFGRVDDDGPEHYITLGCGMHAVQGRTGVTKWFFVTRQRIGQDLFLQTPTRQALSQEGLKQALGASGQLFTTADAYRKAVDTALFQLGPERYAALVDLLIKLRQPQLSRELNEARLSKALSDALPPLPAAVLTEVAEAFRSLEDDQAKLRTYEAARDGAHAFLKDYERYCKVAVLRRTDTVRETNAAYEGAQRQLRTHETERDAAARIAAAAEATLARLTGEITDAETRIDVLEDSDAMRDADALARAEQQAAARAKDSEAAAKRLREAAEADDAANRALADATRTAEAARGAVVRKLELARSGAAAIGQAEAHDAALRPTGVPEPCESSAIERARRVIDTLIKDRKNASAHVRGLVQALVKAEGLLHQKNALRVQAETAVDDAEDSATRAHDRVTQEGERMGAALRSWAGALHELTLPTLETLSDDLARWCELGDGENPMSSAVDRAADLARQHLSNLVADARQRETLGEAALKVLLDEQRQLAEGRHAPPPAPYTRDPKTRSERPGAPLWRVCEFRPELDEAARAGLEAALEASGLLDAWVTPAGELLAANELDTCLVSTGRALAGTSLAQLLRVDIDRSDAHAGAIAPATVEAILARISVREGDDVWVDTHGRWQLGPLHGAWHKPAAQHIGASAREVHRRQRLDQLALLIEQGRRELLGIRDELAELTRRKKALTAELAAAPKDSGVRQAHATLTAARTQLSRLREKLIEAERAVRDAHDATEAARRTRDDDARDLGLSPWVDHLQRHDDALGDYRQAVAELWPAITALDGARLRSAEATTRAAGTRQTRDAAAGDADAAVIAARKAEVEYRTLEETRGAAAREIVAQLAALRVQHDKLVGQQKQEGKRRDEHRLAAAVAGANVERATADMQRHDEARVLAIGALQRFAALGLLLVACPGLADIPDADSGDWSVKRAVELARRVDQSLADTTHDDAAWNRAQSNFHQEYEKLQQALRSLDFSPAIRPADDGLYVVTVPFRGLVQAIPEFRDTLNDEIRERQALLAADERRILEEHLISEIAAHLRELLHAGELWIRKVNEVLASRATSTGMTLRFVWLPAEDGPPELEPARARLLRSASVWSPREREEVGRFLQTQIARVRATDEPATWQEHLERAFDYRQWHRIVVERKQDGAWKRLTKRTHGTGSGGEKAIALTLPQFAAASAHYDSAHPLAPRLILLDEAFVGVDSDMRSKCMSFLDHFDLDFVMTSEREWGCYATLPGVAIYQLVNRPGIWAVGMTRWLWNGNHRVRTELPSASPRAPQAASATPQLSLVGGDDGDDGDVDELDGA